MKDLHLYNETLACQLNLIVSVLSSEAWLVY